MGGRPASFCSQCEGSSNAGMMNSESTPSFSAVPSAKRSASSIAALRGPSIFAIRSEFFQIGTPSLRQYSPNAQRGRLSPGYHLPCPKCSRPPGANRVAQFANEIVGKAALGRSDRGNIPFRRFQIVDGNEGRLAAHRQAHVAGLQIGIDLFAEPVETRPGFVGERSCDPRRLADPLDAHLEAEFDFGESDRAADRRRRAIMRRGGDGDVPLAGQHARGDVESDPARTRQIDFGPGVQIRKIVLDLARSFDRIDVGTQLNEIARDETGGEPEMPQDLNQQPCRVAARARARLQRLLRRLDARLHADDVANLLLQLRVEIDQKIDRARRLLRNLREIGGEQRPGLVGRQIRREFGLEIVGIGERKTVGIRLDKEIERIDHGHLRREVDFDLQLGGLSGNTNRASQLPCGSCCQFTK